MKADSVGGKMSRDKGARWERALAHLLSDIWPGAKRGIQQTRSASEEADCLGTPFWVEAKVGPMPNPRAAMRQAEKATDGRVCVAIVRDDGKAGKAPDDWAMMRLSDWLDIMAELESVKHRLAHRG